MPAVKIHADKMGVKSFSPKHIRFRDLVNQVPGKVHRGGDTKTLKKANISNNKPYVVEVLFEEEELGPFDMVLYLTRRLKDEDGHWTNLPKRWPMDAFIFKCNEKPQFHELVTQLSASTGQC